MESFTDFLDGGYGVDLTCIFYYLVERSVFIIKLVSVSLFSS